MLLFWLIVFAAGIAFLYSIRSRRQRYQEAQQEDIIRAMQVRIIMDNEMMKAMKIMMQSASAAEHSALSTKPRRNNSGGGQP